MSQIASIHGRQILDSRGNPTVEVDVYTTNGTVGRAAVNVKLGSPSAGVTTKLKPANFLSAASNSYGSFPAILYA